MAYDGDDELKEKLKQLIEEAGCPFISTNQLLVRSVCLMPYYQSNEPPIGLDSLTHVNIDLQEVYILEIDEKRNKITIQMSQDIQWIETRIRANFSAVHPEINLIKLAPNNFFRIWHPDLELYVPNLLEREFVNDPNMFKEIAVIRGSDLQVDTATLSGWKDWRAIIHCKFDFSSFPFDIQRCEFLQQTVPNSMARLFYFQQYTENLEHEAEGFEVLIEHVGTFAHVNDSHLNSLQGTDTIGFNITLNRVFTPYLYQYYLPCMAIVAVSQISFMIPLSAIPGRVALVVTQFLTLTNIFIHQMVRHNEMYVNIY